MYVLKFQSKGRSAETRGSFRENKLELLLKKRKKLTKLPTGIQEHQQRTQKGISEIRMLHSQTYFTLQSWKRRSS
jgi:hypothetical protein